MIRRYVEIQCDGCGSAEHFDISTWTETAREYGWIITRAGKHYCQKECRPKTKVISDEKIIPI